jgi:Glycosyltransferase WbsX
MSKKVSCIAYYLGQFHPIPENDSFWGEGFTEWHNVARARPLYRGHEQPKLPGRFGFYDLRCSQTLEAQIDYAQEIGVTAFCCWHYWFSGKRVLHRPLDAMLKLDRPQFRFILGWANESWSGVWHGAPNKLIIEQSYGKQELADHASLLSAYINSGRYLEIDGRFPFVIYKPKQIPNPIEYLGQLREHISLLTGAKLYMIGNWSPGRNYEFSDPAALGLDAAVVTPIGTYFRSSTLSAGYRFVRRNLGKSGIGPEIRRYEGVISNLERGIRAVNGISHATVVTGWDNTPRTGRRGLVLSGYNEHSLRRAAKNAIALESKNQTPILFLKSWNEWAEGNTMEPIFHERWSVGATLKELLRCD